MLANHASRLLPLRKGGGGAGSSKRGAGLAHSETEGAMEERRIRRWWALFGDSLSHVGVCKGMCGVSSSLELAFRRIAF